jgi:hypothetical protein
VDRTGGEWERAGMGAMAEPFDRGEEEIPVNERSDIANNRRMEGRERERKRGLSVMHVDERSGERGSGKV